MSLSEDIKDFALDLGYSVAGITDAEGFPDYVSQLKTRYEMYSYYIEGQRRPLENAFPIRIMPNAKAIVSLVHDISKEAFPENLTGKVGRIYQARAYLTPVERINGARRHLMRQFLERSGCQVADITVPERLTAARAGVTTYGKNTFAFADGIGSFIVLHSFVVDAELDIDEPTLEVRCPPDCRICVGKCPTGALYEPLRMDPRKCIAYNTFTTQDGNAPGVTSYIPPEIREKMGTWIHGCDICQEVCPRNKSRLPAMLPENEFLFKIAEDFDLRRVLNLTDEYYRTRVHPLMYNYIKEKKYFQRNAAIALGNTGDSAHVSDLALAIEDPEALVRGYAAWALGRIRGCRAREVLDVALRKETDDMARREIEAALSFA